MIVKLFVLFNKFKIANDNYITLLIDLIKNNSKLSSLDPDKMIAIKSKLETLYACIKRYEDNYEEAN